MKRSVFILIELSCCFLSVAKGQNSTDMQSGKLVVAACQFPVSADISENYNWIKNQIIEAKLKKADVVQFSERALSGYPGVDLKNLDGYDWDLLYNKNRFCFKHGQAIENLGIVGFHSEVR